MVQIYLVHGAHGGSVQRHPLRDTRAPAVERAVRLVDSRKNPAPDGCWRSEASFRPAPRT